MATDIAHTMEELGKLAVPQLKQRYIDVFGEPTRTNHKRYLMKRIVWRVKAFKQDRLSERTMCRAAELSNDSELRLTAPRPRPYTPAAGWIEPKEFCAAIMARASTPRSG